MLVKSSTIAAYQLIAKFTFLTLLGNLNAATVFSPCQVSLAVNPCIAINLNWAILLVELFTRPALNAAKVAVAEVVCSVSGLGTVAWKRQQ